MLAILLALGTAVGYGTANYLAPVLGRRMPLAVVLLGSQFAGLVVSALLSLGADVAMDGQGLTFALLAGRVQRRGAGLLLPGRADRRPERAVADRGQRRDRPGARRPGDRRPAEPHPAARPADRHGRDRARRPPTARRAPPRGRIARDRLGHPGRPAVRHVPGHLRRRLPTTPRQARCCGRGWRCWAAPPSAPRAARRRCGRGRATPR